MITPEFAPKLLTTINTIEDNPVHLLFNQWWRTAPDDVKQEYVDEFLADERLAPLADETNYADPLDLAQLAGMAPGSLGLAYHDWIVDNGLQAQIATDYRRFHEQLESAGMLDGMPDVMRYAVLRGFQTHDFQHVVTGYDSSGLGEIALQAFCLAQLRFPYFAMWISTVTAQMTYVRPSSITPLMDAITDGWQLGRRVANIQAEPWETMLDEPLGDIKRRHGVAPTPLMERLAAGHASAT